MLTCGQCHGDRHDDCDSCHHRNLYDRLYDYRDVDSGCDHDDYDGSCCETVNNTSLSCHGKRRCNSDPNLCFGLYWDSLFVCLLLQRERAYRDDGASTKNDIHNPFDEHSHRYVDGDYDLDRYTHKHTHFNDHNDTHTDCIVSHFHRHADFCHYNNDNYNHYNHRDGAPSYILFFQSREFL